MIGIGFVAWPLHSGARARLAHPPAEGFQRGEHDEDPDLLNRCSSPPYFAASGFTSCSAQQPSRSSISCSLSSRVPTRSISPCSLGFMCSRVGSIAGSTRPLKTNRSTQAQHKRRDHPHRPSEASEVEPSNLIKRTPWRTKGWWGGDQSPPHHPLIDPEDQRRGSALRTEMARPIHSTF